MNAIPSIVLAILVSGCAEVAAAGGHSATKYDTEITNKGTQPICSVDLVWPASALEKKETTTTTKLDAPLKPGEAKTESITLNIGTPSTVRFFDCSKKQISEATLSDSAPRKVAVP